MKVFHYSSLEDWSDITSSALRPRCRLGQEYKPAFELRAIFGLFEAEPVQWSMNKDFPNSWKCLLENVGRLLLEIEIDPSEAYVIERGHMEAFLYGKNINPPEKFRHSTRGEAEKAYYNSIVPFNYFRDQPEKYNYSLPEILILKEVPVIKLSVSKTQKKIEAVLQTYDPSNIFRASMLDQIRDIPGLEHIQ